MSYQVKFDASVERELAKIDSKSMARILSVIDSLAENPRPPRCLKLKGSSGLYRIRVGNYRIIYTIEDRLNFIAGILISRNIVQEKSPSDQILHRRKGVVQSQILPARDYSPRFRGLIA